jgi:hypothetical protein
MRFLLLVQAISGLFHSHVSEFNLYIFLKRVKTVSTKTLTFEKTLAGAATDFDLSIALEINKRIKGITKALCIANSHTRQLIRIKRR